MTWHSGNEYSGRDMARMQAEAAERVREMQERARRVVDMTPPASHSGHFSVPAAPPVIQVPQSRKSTSGSSSAGGHNSGTREHGNSNGSSNGGFLSGFGGLGSLGGLITGGADSPISRAMEALGIDNDKIIIMILLFVLINNKADKKLILALCYVLL